MFSHAQTPDPPRPVSRPHPLHASWQFCIVKLVDKGTYVAAASLKRALTQSIGRTLPPSGPAGKPNAYTLFTRLPMVAPYHHFSWR